MEYVNILFNEPPLVVSPRLAKLIGLNEAIILQQLHYWLQKNPKIRDDRAWIYNTYEEWLKQLPFRCVDTVKRTINKLVADGLIIRGEFNKASFDKTSWYSINYEALNSVIAAAQSNSAICTNGGGQNAPIEQGNLHSPIPEINTEITTEITYKKEKAAGFDSIIAEYTQNSDLVEALRGFVKMRAANKKHMTDRALKMLLAKLKEMSEADAQKIAILDQSIFHGWQDVYPLKDEKQQTQPRESRKQQSPLEQLDEFLKVENG
jgi:hypothetical protein